MPGSPLIKSLLCQANAYPHDVIDVRYIETHISWVLLTGTYAYKIKKPVNFGFLDFSTLEKRLFYCKEEIRLNQRLARDWYLGVVPITGHAEHPIICGADEPIEFAVKMRQFPSSQTLKDIAVTGQLAINEIDQISGDIAEFHNDIEIADRQSPYGESADIKHWSDENILHIKPLLEDPDQILRITNIEKWCHDEWFKKLKIMQQRKDQGYVRECHGDLHLGNMSLIAGNVILFDCIEFNPMLRWIDVISEVAFLVMDLMHCGYDSFAYRFLNRYLQKTGDYRGLSLFRYYFVYRAMVRAKVTLLRKAQQPDDSFHTQISSEYSSYIRLTERIIKSQRPMLFITHGFSGSGKSTYASQLAEKIGALQIRSDIERKRLFGNSTQIASASGIGNGIYTEKAGEKTYHYLAEIAETILEAGISVIVDATFLRSEQRKQFSELANQCKVKFIIIDFQASKEALHDRIVRRKNDPSEATIEVLLHQQLTAEPLTADEQNKAIYVNTEENDALAKLLVNFY